MSLLKKFLVYLGESGYGVRKYNYLQEYEVLSDTLSLGTFIEDGDNLVFFYDDNRYMPLRNFILDDLEIADTMRISRDERILVITGFKHV